MPMKDSFHTKYLFTQTYFLKIAETKTRTIRKAIKRTKLLPKQAADKSEGMTHMKQLKADGLLIYQKR